MTSRRLNFAGFLAKHFITSKLTLVFIIAVALMGVVAVLQTPREENPQIIVPTAAVMVGLPGASASEVESLVVTPLEGILSDLPGVDACRCHDAIGAKRRRGRRADRHLHAGFVEIR